MTAILTIISAILFYIGFIYVIKGTNENKSLQLNTSESSHKDHKEKRDRYLFIGIALLVVSLMFALNIPEF